MTCPLCGTEGEHPECAGLLSLGRSLGLHVGGDSYERQLWRWFCAEEAAHRQGRTPLSRPPRMPEELELERMDVLRALGD